MGRAARLGGAALLGLLLACPGPPPQADAGAGDAAAAADASGPADAASLDHAGGDSAAVDQGAGDQGSGLDAGAGDAAQPDAPQSDAASPADATGPDAHAADGATPDAALDAAAAADATPVDVGPMDAGDPPSWTGRLPLAAIRAAALGELLRCEDPDGNPLQISLDGADSCSASLTDLGDGTAEYRADLAGGTGGSSCTLAVRCSDGEHSVLQTGDLLVVDPQISAAGRWHTSSALPYPGLLARGLTLYLPELYAGQPERRFEVLVMHDGQNLFDPGAPFGEWQVDEVLDALTAEGAVPPQIVVGVDNTAERMSDYTADVDSSYGGGNGDAYADFLVDLVLPLVDSRYRSLAARGSRTVMGSSLGGIISLHILERHPQAFGRVGAVSPSLWWNGGSPVSRFTAFTGPMPERLWLDIGTGEGGGAYAEGADPTWAYRQIRSSAAARGLVYGDGLGYLEDPGAAHNEPAWAARLDSILWFLLATQRPRDLAATRLTLTPFQCALSSSGAGSQANLAVEALHGGRVRLTWPNADAGLQSQNSGVFTVASDGQLDAVASGAARVTAALHGLGAGATLVVGSPATRPVHFVVEVPGAPTTPAGSTIHVSGDLAELGSWDGIGLSLSSVAAQRWEGELALPASSGFAYKVTRGSWATVEKTASGAEVPNRVVDTARCQDPHAVVEAWADN